MSEINSQQPAIEAFEIPEGSIVIEASDVSDSRSIAITALKKILEDRNLSLPLGPELGLKEPERLISLNKFAVQVVITGFTSDEITIPLKAWYQSGAAPQLLLAAQVDEENNVVFFHGVLTASEFEQLISKHLNGQQAINLSVDQFAGGIDRLLRFVRLLEPSAIPREGLITQSNSEWNWNQINRQVKRVISITVLGAGMILLGPELLRPKLSGSIASLTSTEIQVAMMTRGSIEVGKRSICLLTPEKNGNQMVAFVSIDRPVIIVREPLSEINISIKKSEGKDQVLFRRSTSSKQRIEGPIHWPTNYPIQPGEVFDLSFRPKGFSPGSSAIIQIQANPNTKLQQLDSLINSLGNDDSRWIKAINRALEKDKNVALTLLFSKNSPKTKAFNEARDSALEDDSCSKAQ